jgi:hypothetical protein
MSGLVGAVRLVVTARAVSVRIRMTVLREDNDVAAARRDDNV